MPRLPVKHPRRETGPFRPLLLTLYLRREERCRQATCKPTTTSSSAPDRPARWWPTGCRPTRATRCCCWRPAPPAIPGRASRSATRKLITNPAANWLYSCGARGQHQRPQAPGAARPAARRLQRDQRHGLRARPGAGLRHLGADGQPRLELRGRPALLQAHGKLRGRRRRRFPRPRRPAPRHQPRAARPAVRGADQGGGRGRHRAQPRLQRRPAGRHRHEPGDDRLAAGA